MAETFTPDNLIAGDFPIATGNETLDTGVLSRGSVLGKVTTGGKVILSDSAATDGSQNAYAILAEDADASSADVDVPVYYTGQFASTELTFGGTDVAADRVTDMRNVSLFQKATSTGGLSV